MLIDNKLFFIRFFYNTREYCTILFKNCQMLIFYR